MNFVGKYVFTMPTPRGELESTLFVRNYYNGTLHGLFLSAHGGTDLAQDMTMDGNTLRFKAQAGPCLNDFEFSLSPDGNSFTGKVLVNRQDDPAVITEITGTKSAITPADDGVDKITHKNKALILYATMTKNTEKVATWFKETFEHYGMEVTMIRIVNSKRWLEGNEDKIFFDDYDVVCLGSPIIGGSPMKCILTHFSAGAASALEDRVAKNAEAGLSFNAGGAGGFKEGDVRGGPGMPPPPPDPGMPPPPPGGPGAGGPPPDMIRWRREEVMNYPGGPHIPGYYQPIGIAFTTYGGGFCGPDEALPVLSLLRLYLEDKGAKVIGRFACPGKEFGPAGLDDGVTPMQVSEPPVFYKDADGNYHAGSFFFHAHANSRPGPREEAQARAFIADIVEDHFLTSDGKRRTPSSEYISIS